MPTVRFLREGIEVEVEKGANLREVAMEAGVEVYRPPFNRGWPLTFNCHGFGHCGTCRVLVKNNTMDGCSDLSFWEKCQFYLGFSLAVIPYLMPAINAFDFVDKQDELRLSCQVTVEDDVDVYTRPAVNLYGNPDWQYAEENPAITGQALPSQPPQTPFERGEMEEISEEEG